MNNPHLIQSLQGSTFVLAEELPVDNQTTVHRLPAGRALIEHLRDGHQSLTPELEGLLVAAFQEVIGHVSPR